MRRAVALAVALLAAGAAHGDAASDAAAIRGRLEAWAAAFNARDASTVCELFAADLVSDAPGAIGAGKNEVCGRLERLLARDAPRFAYVVAIDEVVVRGDQAAVRLAWTLEVTAAGEVETSVERGLDLFRRDADGAWRITRFMAFTEAPAP